MCRAGLIIFDWQWPGSMSKQTQSCQSQFWCIQVEDITLFQLSPVRRVQTKKKQKKHLMQNGQKMFQLLQKIIGWLQSLVIRS